MLFKGSSVAERGTLAQLRNAFGHRAVKKDVMNSFNYVENFMRFVTEAHVTYLAMKLYQMQDIEDVPSG